MHTDNAHLIPIIQHADTVPARIEVFRNPVSGLIHIVFYNYEETAALDYEVADNTGKIVLHGHWPLNKGQNKTLINLSLLAAGSYRLSIRSKVNNEILASKSMELIQQP